MNNDLKNLFLKAVPKINRFQSELLSLIKTLERNALTGKISSLHIAETLFEFIENTKEELFVLQEELTKNLVKENVKKVFLEINSRAQVIIDILIRNLFERTADVGFLSTDRDIVNFVLNENRSEEDFKFIKNRLKEYVKKYSVYDEIVVFDLDGNVLINLDENNHIKSSHDSIIKDAIETRDYVEVYRHSDIQKEKKSSLIFASSIKRDKEKVGVLALCFKFEDEMSKIFEKLGEIDRFIYTLVDDKNTILSSSNNLIRKTGDKTVTSLDSLPKPVKTNRREFLIKTSKTKGYEGYSGQEWYANVLLPINTISKKSDSDVKMDRFSLEKSNVLPQAVKDIQEKWDGIEGDLSDVIINGELIASRLKEYVLNPLLDNIRVISTNIYEVMESAIEDIQSTIISSILNDSKFRAKLAIDIMDRNLYERANDCRWWALTSAFREILDVDKVDEEHRDEVSKILKYINGLYTVYTNLFIFDKHGKVIAMSNNKDSQFLGHHISDDSIKQTLSNTDTQKYFVTDFTDRKLYKNKPTYIYSASITSLNSSHQTVGGIGIVFDSTPQFKSMLDDVLPTDEDGEILKGCFSVFIDENQKIISTSSNSELNIGDKLSLDESFLTEDKSEILNIFNSYYCVGSSKSTGYREYKTADNYKNVVYSIVFIKIDMIHQI